MSDPSPIPVRRPRLWWIWVGYWCCLALVMHIPKLGSGGLSVKGGDKAIHFALYALLAWLGGRVYVARHGRLDRSVLLLWMLVYAAYGALDEWTQGFIGRNASLYDWLADAAGIVTATIVLIASETSKRRNVETSKRPRVETSEDPEVGTGE
jgi:hypothetical protein